MRLDKVVLSAREHHQINGTPAGIRSQKKGTDAKTRAQRRIWTKKEEEALLTILKKEVAGGSRCENGTFRAGTMTRIERELNLILPNSRLKYNPHIDSKQKMWKKQHKLIFSMLNTSGFRWNHVKKCVEVDNDEVWQSYLEVHSQARGWRDKPFPFYERLNIIYGDEHVTAERGETPADMVEEINQEEIQEDNRVDKIVFENPSSPLSVHQHQASSSHQTDRTSSKACSRKRRRTPTGPETSNEKRRGSENRLAAGIEKICSTIQHVFTSVNQNMEVLAKRTSNDREDRSDIVDELAAMRLDQDDEIRALLLILEKPSYISAFKSLKDERRLAFVKHLLSDRAYG